ncbi:MAG TPA: type II toxin-antitoxin system VapC family toxin [Acidimicrobiales bacterium]
MAFLLDTNIISEVRKPRPDGRVTAWLASVEGDDLFLSVLVVGEIGQGIERLRRRDPRRAAAYAEWLVELRTAYADRIVPVDLAAADEWGRLNSVTRLPVVDGLLAATAKVRGWTLVTRNTRDVAGTGVRLLDPFAPPA